MSGSKYHQYGRDILTRLQWESVTENHALFWMGPITTLIAEIAGAGNVTEMKKRLLEYGAIRKVDEVTWEVARHNPDHWDYASHRTPVVKRSLTKVELRDNMIDRLTQYMTEIKAALDVLIIGSREMQATLDTLANDLRGTETITYSPYRQSAFEEYLRESNRIEDTGRIVDGSEPTGTDGV